MKRQATRGARQRVEPSASPSAGRTTWTSRRGSRRGRRGRGGCGTSRRRWRSRRHTLGPDHPRTPSSVDCPRILLEAMRRRSEETEKPKAGPGGNISRSTSNVIMCSFAPTNGSCWFVRQLSTPSFAIRYYNATKEKSHPPQTTAAPSLIPPTQSRPQNPNRRHRHRHHQRRCHPRLRSGRG